MANLDGTFVNPSFITGANEPDGVTLSVPAVQLSPAAPPAFATTPRETLSRPVALTVSNAGRRDLSTSGLSFTGSESGGFHHQL